MNYCEGDTGFLKYDSIGTHGDFRLKISDSTFTSLSIYTKILEVKLFAFAYRLFHEDFSSIDGDSIYIYIS